MELLSFSLESSALLGYLGPGMGAGAIAVVLGLLAAVFLAIFAVLWYPLKKMIRSMRGGKKNSASPSTVSAAGEEPQA